MNKSKVFTREQFVEWGRNGGKTKSENKQKAAQKNGKLGGRPKKK